jgi:hypothetical protein
MMFEAPHPLPHTAHHHRRRLHQERLRDRGSPVHTVPGTCRGYCPSSCIPWQKLPLQIRPLLATTRKMHFAARVMCSLTIRVFLTLWIAAACAASDRNSAVADASCSASIKPSDATLAVAQTALLACNTVLEPTGALDWLIDVRQVRLRDVLDARFIHAVEQPTQHSVTLAQLVHQCWPGSPLLFRVFLSDADKQLHSRACDAASAAAADALHSPVLGLTRAVLSFDSLPTIPIIIAASVLPHVTVAVLLFAFAPAAIVAAPLWSLAVVLFALIDLCHTSLRAASAFRSSTNRFLTFFLRRMFARIAVALVVAVVDIVALSLSASTPPSFKPAFFADRTSPHATDITLFAPRSHRNSLPLHWHDRLLPLLCSSLLATSKVICIFARARAE